MLTRYMIHRYMIHRCSICSQCLNHNGLVPEIDIMKINNISKLNFSFALIDTHAHTSYTHAHECMRTHTFLHTDKPTFMLPTRSQFGKSLSILQRLLSDRNIEMLIRPHDVFSSSFDANRLSFKKQW